MRPRWRPASLRVVPVTLRRTALYDAHVAAGAKMVEFAGWEMPVQYEGVRAEHLAVREACGIFDVSHMGEIEVSGPQALELLNNELVLDWSRSLAGRVWNDAGMTPEAQVDRAWRFAYARAATVDERKEALAFLDRQSAMLGAHLSQEDARKAALTDLCHMLVNSNEFLYVN